MSTTHKVVVLGWPVKRLEKVAKLARIVVRKLPPMYHVGVVVDGKCYDFYQKGQRERREIPTKKLKTFRVAHTTRTEEEISSFLKLLKDKYQSHEYNEFTRNCIDFSEELCNFLGIDFQQAQEPTELNQFLKKHQDKLKKWRDRLFIGRILGIGPHSAGKYKLASSGHTETDSFYDSAEEPEDDDDPYSAEDMDDLEVEEIHLLMTSEFFDDCNMTK